MQRYKIYINESPLILTQTSDLGDETAFERSLIHALYRGKPKMLLNYIELLEKTLEGFQIPLQLYKSGRWISAQSFWKSTPDFQTRCLGPSKRETGSW